MTEGGKVLRIAEALPTQHLQKRLADTSAKTVKSTSLESIV